VLLPLFIIPFVGLLGVFNRTSLLYIGEVNPSVTKARMRTMRLISVRDEYMVIEGYVYITLLYE